MKIKTTSIVAVAVAAVFSSGAGVLFAADEEEVDAPETPEIEIPISEPVAKADLDEDGDLSDRELALRDHREKLKLYDLNHDNQISEDEWKAANKDAPERNGKFNLIDKDQDGEINEDEAMNFLMERISVGDVISESAAGEAGDTIESDIEENAPSEVRFTLFSIPLG